MRRSNTRHRAAATTAKVPLAGSIPRSRLVNDRANLPRSDGSAHANLSSVRVNVRRIVIRRSTRGV